MADDRRKTGNLTRGSQQAALREMLLRGVVTRRELATPLDVHPISVSPIVRPLIDAGLVQERMEEPGERPVRPGRRVRPLAIDPRGGQVLGIGITPVFQTVALADLGRNIIAATDFVVEPIEDSDRVIRRVAQESRRLIGLHLEDRSRLLGGLLMVTAVVDPARGSITHCPYLGWGPVPIRAQLAELLNLPLQVRMLTNALIQTEMLFGEARGRRNVLGLLCGLGIAAAVAIDGHVANDSDFPTGGIGMMTVTGEDGTAGTLDDHASGLGILRRLHGGARPGRVSLAALSGALDDVIKRDRAGDPPAAAQMARAGRELGRLVVQHGNFVRPEMVLIAGPLAAAPSYTAAIRETVEEGLDSGVEVAASRAIGAEGGWWSSCSMAVYEYLVEQPLDLSLMSPPAA